MQAGNEPPVFGPDSDPAEYRRWQMLQAIRATIPARFRAPVEIPDPVRAWAERGEEAGGLYLTGTVGAGKTHLAFAALAEWCVVTDTTPRRAYSSQWEQVRYPPTVHMVRMTTLLDQLRPGADDAREVITDCQRTRLLFIDDVGAEKPSEWTQEKIYEVVDERYAQCKPLIVTSNLPPKALAEHVGERTASRLAEMCTVVALTGADRRRPS